MNSTTPRGPMLPPWFVLMMFGIVGVVWLLSSLARFANPDRYPVPAEVHYAMGLVLSMIGGAAMGWPRRRDIPPRPPMTPPEVTDGAE